MKKPALWISPKAMDPGIRQAVESLRIVDTHEHLDEEAVRLGQPLNLTRFFMYYCFDDVATAGLSKAQESAFFDDKLSAMEQWRLIRQAWPLARHTGYNRALTLSIQQLYGIDDLRDDTIIPLMKQVEKKNKPGVLNWILKEECGIECCLVNAGDPGDLSRRTDAQGLFLFDMAVSSFCGDLMKLGEYEKASGIQAKSLKDCVRLIDWYFARWGSQIVAIKNVCAYWRTLYFEDVPEARASKSFDNLVKLGKDAPASDLKAAQDYLFHHCIRRSIDLKIPVKIHTGYHSGHNYSDMDLFRVRNLANLFRQYPQARFDLFHMSWPEWPDLLALTKHYANVWADLCWAWIIDPIATMGFCNQAITAIPSNKLFAFGGDYGFADTVYGHARIARDGISKVLSDAHKEGRLSKSDAKEIAGRWLRENAMEFFDVEAKRAVQRKGQPAELKSR